MGQRIHLGELAGLAPQPPTFDDFDHMFRSDGQEQVRVSAEPSSELVLLDTQTPEGFSMYRAPDGTVLVDVPAEYIPVRQSELSTEQHDSPMEPQEDSDDGLQHTSILQFALHRTGTVDVSASGPPSVVFTLMKNLSQSFPGFEGAHAPRTAQGNTQPGVYPISVQKPDETHVASADIQGMNDSIPYDGMLGFESNLPVDEHFAESDLRSSEKQARVRNILTAPATKRLLKIAIFAGVAIPVYHKGYDVGHDMISHLPVVSLLKGFFN